MLNHEESFLTKLNMVIHFPRCEVQTIHVGRWKVSESVNGTETEVQLPSKI